MDEDHLNMEIRRFLKKVGIASQREIEKQLYGAEESNKISKGDDINLEVVLHIKQLNSKFKIEGNIKIH